ncbi:MAG: hypothetical protein AAF690_26960 [Acidobacteriota bacterium]
MKKMPLSGSHLRQTSRGRARAYRPAIAVAFWLALLWGCAPATDGEGAQNDLVHIEGLGSLSFPNSGAVDAQDPFLRGVLLLHSFEFEASAKEFVRAQEIDPDFALAYWGEALTYNHPLWRYKGREDALNALGKLGATPEERRARAPTEREKMYLDAAEALFADGTKAETDRRYMEAMAKLQEAFPEDDEARAFHALSILGSVNGQRDFATYVRAGATVQPVFDANPKHPGAAHYLIHSYDDPIHAPLGLPAAEVYADVAPNAAHAQHMTTHIFLALGMWDETVNGNIRARDTQDAYLADLGREPNLCGHYAAWLHYGHLQRGDLAEAEALMDSCHERVLEKPEGQTAPYFVGMRARHVVDTEDWSLADRWQAEIPEEDVSDFPDNDRSSLRYDVTTAFAKLKQGDTAPAQAVLVKYEGTTNQAERSQLSQLRGLVDIAEGNTEAGLARLREGAALSESLPFGFGPPNTFKPAFELLGEELTRAGRQEEATAAYRTAASRTPKRPLAEKGLPKT